MYSKTCVQRPPLNAVHHISRYNGLIWKIQKLAESWESELFYTFNETLIGNLRKIQNLI